MAARPLTIRAPPPYIGLNTEIHTNRTKTLAARLLKEEQIKYSQNNTIFPYCRFLLPNVENIYKSFHATEYGTAKYVCPSEHRAYEKEKKANIKVLFDKQSHYMVK